MNIDIACIFTEEKLLNEQFLKWYEENCAYLECTLCFLVIFQDEYNTKLAFDLLDTPVFTKIFGANKKKVETLDTLYALEGITYVSNPRLVEGNIALAPWL